MAQARPDFTKLEVFGEVPLARFGHTITQGKFEVGINAAVSKSKVILFGGATGDTGKYIITGDTYCLDLISNKWSKLEGKKLNWMTIYRLWNCPITEGSACEWRCRLATDGCLRRSNWR